MLCSAGKTQRVDLVNRTFSTMSVLRVLNLGLLVVACSPTSEPAVDAQPIVTRADAGLQPVVDAMLEDGPLPIVCPPGLPSDFGELGQVVTIKNFSGDHYNVFSNLQNNERWFFAMEFASGQGIFTDGVVPGTYVLAGDDLDMQTCSLCIDLYADEDAVPGPPSRHMVPKQATVIIDSVIGDEVSGRLEEVAFIAIDVTYDGISCGDINDSVCMNTLCLGNKCGQQTLLSGCTTAIGSMDF